MKIICVGDIVGRPGRHAIKEALAGLKEELGAECVIANAENSAGGLGLTPTVADDLFSLGCDVLTLGDHVWDKHDIFPYLTENPFVVRPANFDPETPGRGWCVKDIGSGKKIGVINLLGRVFMRYNTNCPFRELKTIVQEIKKQTPVIIVDMHAEATSEKVALGFYIDGEVSAVVGTHTHIQTADERVLPKGTAYISDLGMTGPYDSVIGQNKENIIKRFLTNMPGKFEVASGDICLCGVLVDVDETTGRARSITRIKRPVVSSS